MERRFDMSDFEQSLKDHADQFKMVPSKRVWNGIYNNLHPGSKWPSITIAILFLFTLITISRLNNSTSPVKNSKPTEIGNSKNIIKNQKGIVSNESSTRENDRGIDFTKSNPNNNIIASTKVKEDKPITSSSNKIPSSSTSSFGKTNPQISSRKNLELKNASLVKAGVKTGVVNRAPIDIVFINEPDLSRPIQNLSPLNLVQSEEIKVILGLHL